MYIRNQTIHMYHCSQWAFNFYCSTYKWTVKTSSSFSNCVFIGRNNIAQALIIKVLFNDKCFGKDFNTFLK